MSKPRAWKLDETIGVPIINPRNCVKLSGPPEQIIKFLLYLKENFPEELDEKTTTELDELVKELENGRT